MCYEKAWDPEKIGKDKTLYLPKATLEEIYDPLRVHEKTGYRKDFVTFKDRS